MDFKYLAEQIFERIACIFNYPRMIAPRINSMGRFSGSISFSLPSMVA